MDGDETNVVMTLLDDLAQVERRRGKTDQGGPIKLFPLRH
jgi:hypothetical protein